MRDYLKECLVSVVRQANCRLDVLVIDDGSIGVTVWNKMYSTAALANVRYPEGRLYEDVSTTWQLMVALANGDGSVAVTGRALFHYCSREGSITGDKSLANCRDFWLAQHAKCEGLPGRRTPALPGLRTSTVAACMVAIGRTWANWGSMSTGDAPASPRTASSKSRGKALTR